MLSGKVVWEACFGTNFDQPATQLPGAPLIPDTKFRSICRSATGSPLIFGDGDSPLNLLNSGEPSPDGLNCASSFMGRNSGCGHGTHVAGIAAGRTNGITGVSPAAKIVSVQIFSFDSNPVFSQRQAPSWFLKDLLLALQAILPFAPVGGKNDLVTTMSIGNLLPVKVPCTSGSVPGSESPRFPPGAPALEAFVLAMNALKAGEVPVIAAAGNDYVPLFGTLFPGPNGLAFPACLPNVIKVGAALNLPIGGQQAGYSNAPDLSLFPRETYWIAPGGGGSDDYSTVGVRSAWIAPGSDGTPYKNLSGTSMAAPHVAGLYANIMAGFRKFNIPFTIQGASDWIRGSGGSFPVDWQFGGVNATYEAIRLHDLAQ